MGAGAADTSSLMGGIHGQRPVPQLQESMDEVQSSWPACRDCYDLATEADAGVAVSSDRGIVFVGQDLDRVAGCPTAPAIVQALCVPGG